MQASGSNSSLFAPNANRGTVEIERTYLARNLPREVVATSGERVVDVYYPTDLAVHPRLRFRHKGSTYEVTKKVPFAEGDASAHREITIPLSESEFGELIKGSNRRLEKNRFTVALSGKLADVDVFCGSLAGLVLIDFEFTSREDLRQFIAPDCCLTDVTQEDFVAGGLLAGRTYADIELKLKQHGYTKIENRA
jgi:CYTH domain-containing protein